ncbi:HMCN [Mytilus edulis]|uniref:HMCN n=1 Tax=Mytilus edulis TaxID=6550 RepID=A0A8S3SXE8_MYTED|nr:HMCN [Mytilus edulis]
MYNGLSGTEGFQTRSSHRDNTRWSKCITVYLALKVFKLEAVIETTPDGVDYDIHENRRIVKRSDSLVEQLIKVQSQILLEYCRNSTHICPDNESRDCKCSEAPLIQNSANHMYATNKTNLLIPCHVTGYPLPYVTWTVNGSRISNNDRFLVREDGLLIQRVTYTDHGSYTCTARNIVGINRKTAISQVSETMAPLSDEEENYVRLALLLKGVTPRAVRTYFDREFPPTYLPSTLNTNYNTLWDLKLKRIINQAQWNLLIPRNGTSLCYGIHFNQDFINMRFKI